MTSEDEEELSIQRLRLLSVCGLEACLYYYLGPCTKRKPTLTSIILI